MHVLGAIAVTADYSVALMARYRTCHVFPVACFNYSLCRCLHSLRRLITLDGSAASSCAQAYTHDHRRQREFVSQQDTTALGLNDMDFGTDDCIWNNVTA